MTVRQVNGKLLKRESYRILKELGIELITYELKVTQDKLFHTWYSFEITGGLTEDCDLEELHELLVMMKIARTSDNPTVKDALEQLKMAVELSK